jgi:hypothetical protein
MGKGSNVQKAQAARERNQKKLGKTDEERKAASAKATKDANAFVCLICRQTFMVNARPPLLYQHVLAKHDGIEPGKCFPVLADFDPSDPKGEKAAAAEKLKKAAAAKKKKAKAAAGGGLDDLLNAGLKTKSKKKR